MEPYQRNQTVSIVYYQYCLSTHYENTTFPQRKAKEGKIGSNDI